MRKGYAEIQNKERSQVKTGENNNENTRKDKIKFLIWFVICIFIYYQLTIFVSYTIGKESKSNMWLYTNINKIVTKLIPQAKETKEEYNLKIAALGDIYSTTNILNQNKKDGRYNFSETFVNTKEVLKDYDMIFASLNTPLTDSKYVYSTNTSHNAPKEIIDDLEGIGISLLATANNHIADKGESGIKDTADFLKNSNIKQIGINSLEEDYKPCIIEKNNIKIAVLSYATILNTKLPVGKEKSVRLLEKDVIEEDIKYIKNEDVDYIICYLNIPNEDTTLINAQQKRQVEMLFENGVNLVLGTGSKVVQPIQEDLFEMPDKSKNHTYVIYSLGDFYGSMDKESRKISVGMDITFTKSITKDKNGKEIAQKTKKNMMINEPLSFYTKVGPYFKTINFPIKKTIEKYNEGLLNLTAADYKLIKEAEENLKKVLN